LKKRNWQWVTPTNLTATLNEGKRHRDNTNLSSLAYWLAIGIKGEKNMEVLILETELPYTHHCEMMRCQALPDARAA